MTTGPFLYDDDPAPLHTGTPRRRNGLIVAVLLGTVLVAVGMVAALFLVRGAPADQSEEAVGVFLSALERGDGETAHGLLCTDVRAEVDAGEVPPEYRQPGPGRVVGSEESQVDGALVYRVEVRWAGDDSTFFTVVNEDGPHLCGMSSAG
jgi:hypothetical protein